MAEYTCERKVVIQVPAAAVYEYLADFPRHAEWNHQPTKMTLLTAGPVGVGSIFRTKEQASGNATWFIKIFWPLLGKLMGTTGYTEAEITASQLVGSFHPPLPTAHNILAVSNPTPTSQFIIQNSFFILPPPHI